MTERQRVVWQRDAKGKGLRWRMLRDLVASCSYQSMTTMEAQAVMRRLWGLKNKTTREILEELSQDRALTQTMEKGKFRWGVTSSGVDSYLDGRMDIPASLAEVVGNMLSVLASEAR